MESIFVLEAGIMKLSKLAWVTEFSSKIRFRFFQKKTLTIIILVF